MEQPAFLSCNVEDVRYIKTALHNWWPRRGLFSTWRVNGQLVFLTSTERRAWHRTIFNFEDMKWKTCLLHLNSWPVNVQLLWLQNFLLAEWLVILSNFHHFHRIVVWWYCKLSPFSSHRWQIGIWKKLNCKLNQFTEAYDIISSLASLWQQSLTRG